MSLLPDNVLQTLLFPVPPVSYSLRSFPNELLWIPWNLDYKTCKKGDAWPAILQRCPGARYLVLYLHSNGEDIGLCYSFGESLRMVLEVHVLLVEYPGYGICPGKCSEESLWQAAQAAYRFATEVLRFPREDVIIMGRSLGACLATRLARTYECHGLILVAPFTSLSEAVGQYISCRLAKMLIGDAFSNSINMRHMQVPLLVVHGEKDRLVPCAQGKQLFELCPHRRKQLVCPPLMGHNDDLMSNADYLIRPMLRFFSLPDYNFDELRVPEEAFNRSLCPLYHGLVEKTRGDQPLPRPLGDQEPYPAILAPELTEAEVLFGEPLVDEELEGFEEVIVRTAEPQSSLAYPSRPRVSSPGDESVPMAPTRSPRQQVVLTGLSLLPSPHEPCSPPLAGCVGAQARGHAVGAGRTGAPPAPSPDAVSTTNGSSSTARHSESLLIREAGEGGSGGGSDSEWCGDPDQAGLLSSRGSDVVPDLFNVDAGIALFMQEAAEQRTQVAAKALR